MKVSSSGWLWLLIPIVTIQSGFLTQIVSGSFFIIWSLCPLPWVRGPQATLGEHNIWHWWLVCRLYRTISKVDLPIFVGKPFGPGAESNRSLRDWYSTWMFLGSNESSGKQRVQPGQKLPCLPEEATKLYFWLLSTIISDYSLRSEDSEVRGHISLWL